MGKLLLLVSLLLLMPMVVAESYEVNKQVNLQFICTLNNEIPTDADYNITITDPLGNIVVDNQNTTEHGQGSFSYPYTFSMGGAYTIKSFCYDGTYSYSNLEEVEVYGIGNTSSKGITETSIYMIIALIVSGFIWVKISRLIGSMLIFLMGFGILFSISANGWIGWLIIVSGFVMLLYALIEPRRRK